MLIRFLISILVFFLSTAADAQMRVRLHYGEDTESALIRIEDNVHSLIINGVRSIRLDKGEMIFVCRAGDKIAVNKMYEKGFLADSITLICSSDSAMIDLSVQGKEKSRGDYRGNLDFSSSLGQLKIINTLEMNEYIAGVVQAEGGYKGHPEYFKAQAVIARTYAHMHKGKHSNEGYDLCDDVHCQVYHGRSVTKVIDAAVSETRGEVLVDSDTLLILTPFHSNCGGETVASENVWLTSLPYLVSVFDPYCAYSRNATWEKEISKTDWLEYLGGKGVENVSGESDLSFSQNSRKINYSNEKFEIPLTLIRSDMDLRSTFFSIKDLGDTLLLAGRGYGHGVGLCQEGAMVMATRGFKYKQILNFYFKKVHIVDIDEVKIKDTAELSF